MKQLKKIINNNAIILTIIDLIGIILYLLIIKVISKVGFNFNLYDFSIIWLFMYMCYSKNKNKELIRIIDKILEKDRENEKNNIR